MKTKLGSEPAFPVQAAFSPECGTMPGYPGLTHRQWLIGMIASGMAASGHWAENISDDAGESAQAYRNGFSLAALKQADSILEAEQH